MWPDMFRSCLGRGSPMYGVWIWKAVVTSEGRQREGMGKSGHRGSRSLAIYMRDEAETISEEVWCFETPLFQQSIHFMLFWHMCLVWELLAMLTLPWDSPKGNTSYCHCIGAEKSFFMELEYHKKFYLYYLYYRTYSLGLSMSQYNSLCAFSPGAFLFGGSI